MEQVLKVKITGVAPLLMHNGQTADPLNEWSKKIKQVTSKRKKTDDDVAEIGRLEWYAALYVDESGSPIIPSKMIEATLKEAAKKSKLGKQFSAGVFCFDDAPLEFAGKASIEKMWTSGKFVSRESARVQQSRVMRTRAKFPAGWSCVASIVFYDDVVNESDVREALANAGRLVGFGDWRPRHGRFDFEII